MGRLDGRVCIVTGGGRGIGASVARALAGQGASVVVNDLGGAVDGTGSDNEPADEVVQGIRDAGGTAVANYNDVSNYDAAEQIVQAALDEYGRLDVLVNVAGILRDRMVFNQTEPEWDAVLGVHLKGTFNTTKFASIHWRQKREGHYRLINFTSESGLFGAPGQPNYAAAKHGIVGFTLSCANALGRYGVTSICMAPGASTRMTDTVPDERRRRPRTDEENPRRSPNNVALPLVYLASTESDWLNGRVIRSVGYRVSLYNTYGIIRQVATDGPWDLDDAFQGIETVLRPAVEAATARSG